MPWGMVLTSCPLPWPPAAPTAILFSDTLEGVEPLPQWPKELFPLKVSGWKVECRETEEKPWEDVTGSIPDLGNISRVFPRFTGTIRYTAAFQSPAQDGYRLLDLGNVGETAQVWLNGKYLGARICQPYAFPLEGVKEGENQLEIQVVNSPAYRERDPFSAFLPLPPSGLMGPVRIG